MVSVKEGMVAGAGAAAHLACAVRGQSVAWTQRYASSQRPSSWLHLPAAQTVPPADQVFKPHHQVSTGPRNPLEIMLYLPNKTSVSG